MAQTELLSNGSFEEWTDGYPTGWKSTTTASNATLIQSTEAHTGANAVEIATGSSNVRLASKEMKLKAGTYTYTVWVKGNGGESIANLGYAPYNEETSKLGSYVYGYENKAQTIATEWTQLTYEFTLAATTQVNLVVMRQKASTSNLLIDDASLTTTDGGLSEGGDDPTPGPDPSSIANTPETAYNVTKALELIAAGEDLNTQVYVAGTISVVTEVSTQYGNATYDITDGTSTLTIFRGKYLEGSAFTSEDQIQDGDEVIVYGRLMLYQKEGQEDKPEMAANNYIYSLNGQTKIDNGGEETPTVTVAEAQAMAANSKAKVNATVYAVCKTGAVLGDATGYIYYYNTGIADLKWNVGDQGTIEGTLSAYGGFNQFTSAANIEYVGHTDVTYPAATELDLDAWVATPAIQFVKLQGTLNISGNYYNILVEGKTAQGSVVGAQDELFAGIANGSVITVEGFAMYTSGSGKYANIVATKVTVDGQGETVDITNKPESAYTVAKAFELIDANKGLEQKVYVKGVITEIVSLDVEKWKRAQYDIADEASSENKLRIYNGHYINGADFTANDQIKVGDEVIVYGQLTKYNETYEMAANNYIYSLNGITDGIRSVGNEQQNQVIYDLAGRRVEKAVKGLYIVNGKKVVF